MHNAGSDSLTRSLSALAISPALLNAERKDKNIREGKA